MPPVPLGAGYKEQIDEPLILLSKVGVSVDVCLLDVLHQLRFQDSFHHPFSSPRYEVPGSTLSLSPRFTVPSRKTRAYTRLQPGWTFCEIRV